MTRASSRSSRPSGTGWVTDKGRAKLKVALPKCNISR